MTLAEWIERNKIDPARIAKAIGVSVSAISHYCAGRRTPSLPIALAIERATLGAVPPESWQSNGNNKGDQDE
jgi:DNA-binding transcriptional regulator YdaS (Cro superfamily)